MSEAQKRARMLGVLSVVMMVWLVPTVGSATMPLVTISPTASMSTGATSRLSTTMMKAPLSFEANQGQTDPSVKFIVRGKGHTIFLTPTESVLVLQQQQAVQDNDQPARHVAHRSAPIQQSVVRMKLEGANPAPAVEGIETLPGIVNYFLGNDPEQWHTQIPTYARVRFTEAYPGIDVVYYGNQGQLEYDFIVAPGADPNHIKLVFDGASDMRVTESGDLLLTTALGDVRMQKPLVYQLEQDGQKTLVAGNYLVSPHAPKEIGFQLAAYDATRSLIIDPSLSYSTYLGGSAPDIAYGVAVDATGNAYVTGGTASLDFPLTTGAVLTVNQNNFDVIVTKFNPTGSALVYSTTLGGSVNDIGLAIAVDATGSASVTGWTQSSNFPTTPGAFQTAAPNTSSAFVAKLNPTGTGLVYSTYLGGSVPDTAPGYPSAIVIPSEAGESIAVDAVGNAYITGRSTSSNFPTTPGALQTTSAGCAGVYYYTCTGFATKLNPAGSALVYSTYLGGTGEGAGYGIAVDATGNAYVTGITFYSPFFPTTPGAYKTPACGACPFVIKLNPPGSALVYASFFGGSGFQDQVGFGIAVDAAGNAYVMGRTNVSDFPTTAGAFQPVKSSSLYDAFVTKLNQTGTGLVYSTYLGGISADNLQQHGHIAVDVAGNAYVTGTTDSAVFPTTPGAFQPTLGGGRDVFVTQLNAAGSGLVYSSYLGGSADDLAVGIAVDTRSPANAYVTGQTFSSNFPTTKGAFQTVYGGGTSDAFVVKIGTNTGNPLAWGDNRAGQVGNGTFATSNTPTHVSNVTQAFVISGGAGHSLAIKADSTAWAWGNNVRGQLGNGTTTTSNVPVAVSGLSQVSVLSGGGAHSLAVQPGGTVWSWGDNTTGQLGLGTTGGTQLVPVHLPTLTGITVVSAGAGHSVALKNDGSVWTWGDNRVGELGNGIVGGVNPTPAQVPGLTGVTAIATFGAHTLALKADGTVWAWGDNHAGQLGHGTVGGNSPVPVQVIGLSAMIHVIAGGIHSLALGSDGLVRAWGDNNFGQLGDGTFTTRSTPVFVGGGLSQVSVVAAGGAHSLAMKVDGTAWAWGNNTSGQLGTGNFTTRPLPTAISGLTGGLFLAGGGAHSLAIVTP